MALVITCLVVLWEGYFLWNWIDATGRYMLWIPLFPTVAAITGMIGYWIDGKLK